MERKYHPVVETIEDGSSVSCAFLMPTRNKVAARIAIQAYKLANGKRGRTFQWRIVDSERAQFLMLSYAEWSNRLALARVSANEEAVLAADLARCGVYDAAV